MSTPHPDEFSGMAGLVTGGASGIGLATARLLTSRGSQVAIIDREIPDGLEGAGTREFIADVTDDDAVRSAVAAAAGAFGGLDILVNNAGIGAAGTVEDNDDAEWMRVLDVNVLGVVRTTRAALPALRAAVARRGQAAIVNTCSIVATAALTGCPRGGRARCDACAAPASPPGRRKYRKARHSVLFSTFVGRAAS